MDARMVAPAGRATGNPSAPRSDPNHQALIRLIRDKAVALVVALIVALVIALAVALVVDVATATGATEPGQHSS
jgi:hypothetical protein